MKKHTQKNGAVLIVNTIKTAPFFCVCPVYAFSTFLDKENAKTNMILNYTFSAKLMYQLLLDLLWVDYIPTVQSETYRTKLGTSSIRHSRITEDLSRQSPLISSLFTIPGPSHRVTHSASWEGPG